MQRDYPDRPIVGVGAIILRLSPAPNSSPQIVLVKRGNPPLVGEWTIPGGMLELGEALEAGAVREAASLNEPIYFRDHALRELHG